MRSANSITPWRKLAIYATKPLDETKKKAEKALGILDSGFFRNEESAIFGLTGDMKELIAVANEEIRKPESQTTELLKRVFIGLIIASFFFAILRYIAAQYRLNWEQVIIANTEDERLRKFYVAFKAAGNNTSDRSALVSSLVSIQASSTNNDNAKEIEIDKTHLELIKEVLNAIAKKI